MSDATGDACRDAALEYIQLGLSPIPLQARSKVPLEAGWERFSAELPTEDTVRHWWQRHPVANVGLVAGVAPRVFVLDVDGELGLASLEGRPLPLTPRSRTGGGGEHVFFRHPGAGLGEIRNRVGFLPGLDIRGDRGQVVAPPSMHPTGTPYSWVVHPREVELADAPDWLLSYVFDGYSGVSRGTARGKRTGGTEDTPAWLEALWLGVEEGARNDTMARIAGRYLGILSESEAMAVCLAINDARFRPPLGVEEVEQVVASIGRAETRKKQSRDYVPADDDPPANSDAPAIDTDERRVIAREAVSVALGVRVESAYRYMTDPPSYELIMEGTRVALESINEMMDQRLLQLRIAAETRRLIKRVDKDRWSSVAQALLDACEDRDVEEGTTFGALEGWLSGFLADYPPESSPLVAEGRDTPFWSDGALLFHSTSLRLWLRYKLEERESASSLATKLRRFGAEPTQVGRRIGGRVRNVRFWKVPVDVAVRLGVAPPSPVEAHT